jgi:hypothetical protein
MSRKLLFIVPLLFFMKSTAQELPVKIELGSFYSYSFDKNHRSGLGFYLHPSYFIIKESLDIGIKAEVLEIGKKDELNDLLHVSALHSYLLTSGYYLTQFKIRPYVKGGLGMYSLKTIDLVYGEEPADFEFLFRFGFAGKIGAELGPFNIGLAYNWVYKPFEGTSHLSYFSLGIGGSFVLKFKGFNNKKPIDFGID